MQSGVSSHVVFSIYVDGLLSGWQMLFVCFLERRVSNVYHVLYKYENSQQFAYFCFTARPSEDQY